MSLTLSVLTTHRFRVNACAVWTNPAFMQGKPFHQPKHSYMWTSILCDSLCSYVNFSPMKGYYHCCYG